MPRANVPTGSVRVHPLYFQTSLPALELTHERCGTGEIYGLRGFCWGEFLCTLETARTTGSSCVRDRMGPRRIYLRDIWAFISAGPPAIYQSNGQRFALLRNVCYMILANNGTMLFVAKVVMYMFRAFYGLAQSIECTTQSRNSYNGIALQFHGCPFTFTCKPIVWMLGSLMRHDFCVPIQWIYYKYILLYYVHPGKIPGTYLYIIICLL